jgi:hypothetical protein
MQTPAEALNKGHTQTELCWDLCARKQQHVAAKDSQVAIKTRFTAYGKELEQVPELKYLGRLLACNDNDTQAMRGNLKRARKCWARISCVLRAGNAALQVCRIFYMAMVMSVLLFGSEAWSLAPGTLKQLDGFHHRAAWRMASMQPTHDGEGHWTAHSPSPMIACIRPHYACVGIHPQVTKCPSLINLFCHVGKSTSGCRGIPTTNWLPY